MFVIQASEPIQLVEWHKLIFPYVGRSEHSPNIILNMCKNIEFSFEVDFIRRNLLELSDFHRKQNVKTGNMFERKKNSKITNSYEMNTHILINGKYTC